MFEPLVGLLNRGYAVSRSEPSANMGAAGPVGYPAPEVMGLRSNPCVVPVAQGADGPARVTRRHVMRTRPTAT